MLIRTAFFWNDPCVLWTSTTLFIPLKKNGNRVHGLRVSASASRSDLKCLMYKSYYVKSYNSSVVVVLWVPGPRDRVDPQLRLRHAVHAAVPARQARSRRQTRQRYHDFARVQ